MATATKSHNKTGFVADYLSKNPRGNVKAVNEAWTAAGMNGTIGGTLINKLRSEMGLTGNLRADSKQPTAAMAKSAPRGSKTTSGQGKTSFVKDYLQKNPQAKSTAVNEAWTAAGFDGTISHTVVSESRKQLGLIGNQSRKTGTVAKAKATPRMSPGKTMFVKEFLHDNPHGNVDAVNQEWQAAGFDGTISPTLVNKMRSALGLTGNLRGTTKTVANGRATSAGKKLERPRKETAAAVNVQPRSDSAQTVVLDDLEVEIDRLLFKVMGIGDLIEIENSLRQVRRLLYGALTGG